MTSSHGTVTRYGRGCRCARCRTAWATYIRERARRGGRRTLATARAAQRMGLPRTACVRPAYYAAKDHALRLRVTGLGRRLLEAAYARTGRDWDDVVEYLLRQHAAAVVFDDEQA